MRPEVSLAIEQLKRQFPEAEVSFVEDGSGGAHVTVSHVDLGPRFTPQTTWMGGQVTAQYPYADIYPVFIGPEVRRVDGVAFQPPITLAAFNGRQAWQISRRNPTADRAPQTASTKFLKVIDFLEKAA